MEDNYLEKLNEQQRAAVTYTDGPELVIAGAGSGKTRVLTYKIVHLLKQGYAPHRIMALTFTNKAAREMRDRIVPLVGEATAAQLWMGTFHSIFARLLRINADKVGYRHDFTIYDDADSRSLVKQIVRDMGLDDKAYKPATVLAHISNAKNALFLPDDYERSKSLREADNSAKIPQVYAIYKAYWQRCRVAGAMDFDDLLVMTNLLLRDNPEVLQHYQEKFQYILVDEYQDTNFAQHLIVKQLSGHHNRMCVVGDDAQSIYSFRGANIANILQLQQQYPGLKTFKLERNYRSTQNIIGAANSLIEKNTQQIRKHIYSENAVGSKVSVVRCYSDYEEAYVVANNIVSLKAQQGCSWDDFAVLYRTNAQSRVLEQALSNGGRRNDHGNVRMAIPYRIYGGMSFYQRKEIKDAVSYFRLTVNPDDDEALRRIINYPARGIGDKTVSKVQHCAMEHQVSMWQVLMHPGQYGLDVNKGTLKKLSGFRDLMTGIMELAAQAANAYDVAREIVERTKLLAVLMGDNTPENISRQENINELLTSVHDFVEEKQESGDDDNQLVDYLAQAALATDQDTQSDDGSCVTLMTVHAAKGLEFRNVIIVGVEEDLFPAARSSQSLAGIEEERRLLYVAITRAQTTCTITYATSRYQNGQTKTCVESRFLHDIDPAYLRSSQTSASNGEGGSRVNPVRNYHESLLEASSGKPQFGKTTSKPVASVSHVRPAPPIPPKQVPAGPVKGNFSRHTAGELQTGMAIAHNRFGRGTITNIDAAADPKITVDFPSLGAKTLLLRFAQFEIIK